MSRWHDLYKDMVKELDLVTVSILGITRTGKTNLAKWFTRDFLYGWGDDGVAYYIDSNYITSLEKVFKREKRAKHKAVAIILDDLTYSDEARDKALAFYLARIKHMLPKANKVLTVAIFHYLTSVMPFVRLTMIRIITSIMSMYEIDLLKQYFDLEALHEFREIKQEDPLRNRFLALTNIFGYHEVINPAKYPYSDPWKKVRVKSEKANNEAIRIYVKLPYTTRSLKRTNGAIYLQLPDKKRLYVRAVKVIRARNVEKEVKVNNVEYILMTPRTR